MMRLLTNIRIAAGQLAAIQSVDPRIVVVQETDPERCRAEFRDAEVYFGYQLPGPLVEAKALKWIQLTSAGVEHLIEAGIQETDVIVTTVSGIHGHAIAEYTLWAMISLARRMPLISREMSERKWRPSRPRTYYGDELYGKTLGIVGMGTIGQEVARLARCLGMQVLGMRRSGRASGDGESFGPSELNDMLGRSDFVLVLLPLTAETRGMIGREQLKSMKSTASLINVSRGHVVDEAALVEALTEGWIAGAAVDVFDSEPLSADSPVWNAPNLIATPHMAGNTIPYMDRATAILTQNLRSYLAGEKMVNLLDMQRAY